MRAITGIVTGSLLLLTVACNKNSDPPLSPVVREEAQQLFGTRCMVCHGPQGAGDGPASAGLMPKPRNFQDKEWQKSVTNDHLEKIIVYGGVASGKSPTMPPNPDLADKKEVVMALRMHIRSLGK